MSYKFDRGTNIRQASFKPGQDESWNYEYKTPTIREKMPSGYNTGEQMHHLVPAELFGAFVQNLNRQEAEIVINRANELGIRVGNDPVNFIGLDKLTEHLRNDTYSNTVHSQLDTMGLESTELSGKDRQQFRGMLNKISSSPLQTRLDALPDFVTYIAEPAIEAGRSFRPKANSVLQNKEQYKKEVQEERLREIRNHNAEELGVPSRVTESEARGKVLTQLIQGLNNLN